MSDSDILLKAIGRQDDGAALCWAAERGHIALAQSILRDGADVDARSSCGETALHGASFHGCLDIAHLLIQAGSDVNARTAKAF